MSPRLLACLLPVVLAAAEVAPAPAPVPAPAPAPAPVAPKPQAQPQTITLPTPKVTTTVRLITLEADGSVGAESQKLLDQMGADGWRPSGLTAISAPGAQPVVLALLFNKTIR